VPELGFECHLSAPPVALWPELLAYEVHAAALPSVQTARVLLADDHARLAEWSVLLRGSPLRWSQREYVDSAELSVRFELHRGDPKHVSGNWSLRPHADGSVASISIDLDFGFPRIATVFNALLLEALTDVVHGIARNAEHAARGRRGPSASSPHTMNSLTRDAR
jgi:ribosome-associated toxin RatA of RatAB toxin-antitoxin module